MKNIAQKKINKNELLSSLLFLSLLICGGFGWGYIYQYVMTAVFFIRTIGKGSKKDRKIFVYYHLPHLVVLIHLFISALVNHETFYVMRGINNFLMISSIIIISYSLFTLHKANCIRVLAFPIIVFFFIRVVMTIANVGIVDFVRNIYVPGSPVLAKWLELHDVGLSIGFLILYYVFFKEKKTISTITFLMICIVFFVSFKRIAIGAFFISAAYIILLNKMVDKKNRLTMIWGITGVVICVGIVYLMSSDAFTNWMWQHNLNVMGRDSLYRFFRPYYKLEPSFFGRGSGFTGKLLSTRGGELSGVSAVHSDILRIYIEYGFIGSILWYSYFLVVLPRKAKKRNEAYGEVVFAFSLYAFIVYVTDNTTQYLVFQMMYMIIPMCILYDGNTYLNRLLCYKKK